MPQPGEVERIEALTASINRLVEKMEGGSGQVVTVVHRSEGMGNWGAAAVTACFCSLFFSLLVYMLVSKDVQGTEDKVRDHDAYIHMQGQDIAKLKAEKQK